MQEAGNMEVVKAAYAAFGRADIPTLLSYMADDVKWQPVIGTNGQVPFSGEWNGKAKVAEFFRIVSETEDFEQFEPREFVAQGDKVVALGHYRAVTKATRRTFDSDFVMVFTLQGGKVAKFQEFTDSAGINAAFS